METYLLIVFVWFSVPNGILPYACCAETVMGSGDESPSIVIAGVSSTGHLDSVAVTGAEGMDRSALERLLLSKKGGILNEGLIERDIETLTGHLRAKGWWNASASAVTDTTLGGKAVLTFRVTPGRPVLFGTITYASKEKGTEVFPRADTTHIGDTFDADELESLIGIVVAGYASKGYPGVTVTPAFSARCDTIDVSLDIETGRRAVIDSIAVYGLERTRDYVIRRELRRFYGRPASHETVAQARAALEKITTVSVAQDPFLEYTPEGRGILAVAVRERKQGTFDGVIGYQPSTDEGKGDIIGAVDLSFPNILGTGRSTQFRWEKMGKGTEELELGYYEPWIFSLPYTVSLSFAQEQRERLGFTKTIVQTSVSRSIGRFHAGAGYRYEKVSSDSVYSTSGHGMHGEITWDTLDNPLNPRSGIRYTFRWSNLVKRYRFHGGDSNRLDRAEFDFDHYIPAFTRHTAAVLVRYRRVETPWEKLSLSDRYWLGGTSSIRGYRKKVFPAVKALWASFEYRVIQGRGSWVFVFLDTGYLVNRTKSIAGGFDKDTLNRTGYGFGLRIDSKAGTLGFDYGLGRGDSIGEGKLHVGLKSAF